MEGSKLQLEDGLVEEGQNNRLHLPIPDSLDAAQKQAVSHH
jgi:hypothetical protein